MVDLAMGPGRLRVESICFSALTNFVIDLDMVRRLVLNMTIYIDLVGHLTELKAIFA